MSVAQRSISATTEALPASGIRPFLKLICMVSLPLLVLDQASKYYIRTHLSLYQSVPIIPGWFDITYTLNPGAAFSMFINAPEWFRTAFLFTLSSIAIVVLAFLLLRDSTFNLTSISLALILAGAGGNLIDRMRLGRVVDFIDWHYYAHHWPIFNVADSAISIGVTLILAHSLFFSPRS